MNKYKLNFKLSLICSLIGALMLFSIVFLNGSGKFYQVSSYIIGGLFWLSIVAEQILFWIANAERKRAEKRMNQKLVRRQMSIGILSFFKTREARFADIILFISAIAMALLIWLKVTNSCLVITTLSILFLSFNLHCFLNGKNFRFIKAYNKNCEGEKKDE